MFRNYSKKSKKNGNRHFEKMVGSTIISNTLESNEN